MSIQPVIETLDRLSELHTQLLSIAEEKKDIIVRNDVDALALLTSREGRLIKQINEVDEERVHAMHAFMKEKGIRSALQLNVTELSRIVFNPDERVQLREAQVRLSDLLHELKRQNETIKDLLQQSLDFVDYSLNLITSRPEDDSIYKRPDQAQSKAARSLFDTRA